MEQVMLIELIDNYLKNRPRDDREIHCFHPSALHKSPYELYQEYLHGFTPRFSSRTFRIMDNGHHVHERLQKYLTDIGVVVGLEVPVENEEFDIVGHCDGILEVNGKRGVLEIKSINNKGFTSLASPRAMHVWQLNIYMFCLGLEHGVLLYENKDNQELKEFIVNYDLNVVTPILDKIRYVQNCIMRNEAPERDSDSDVTEAIDAMAQAFGGVHDRDNGSRPTCSKEAPPIR
jgi:hypothetical protein